ncbi:MAG: sigma-70 family RNA polymerase sigma factor, partial [bacterium]|nr:sigma-70 family RNA polymerase sigma factor [bacterium]
RHQCSLNTWIYRVATNVCLDELRKRDRRPKIRYGDDETYQQFEAPIEMQPEEQVILAEDRQEIEAALLKISSEHRLMLILRDIQSYSYEEIGEIVGLNQGTVKSRLNRARQALRMVLSEMEPK